MCRNFFPGISGGVLTPLTPPPPLGSATVKDHIQLYMILACIM